MKCNSFQTPVARGKLQSLASKKVATKVAATIFASTNPAPLILAKRTGHMIAALIFFDTNSAFRAALNVLVARPIAVQVFIILRA